METGFTVSVAICFEFPDVAVIITLVVTTTDCVSMVNGCETVEPAATVIEAGTVATDGLALVRATVMPPAGAGALSEMVFCAAGPPPVTMLGARFTAAIATGLTLTVPDFVEAPSVAVIVTFVLTETAPAVIVNGKDKVESPGTVMVAGTLAARGFELVNVRTVVLATEPLIVTVL